MSHYLKYFPCDETGLFWRLMQADGFDTVLRRAGLAIENERNGKIFAHQDKLDPNALVAGYGILKTEKQQLVSDRDFESIWARLDKLFVKDHRVNGLGPLYAYDTAYRIGVSRGFRPKFIYLHAGTAVGAGALGLDVSGGMIPKTEIVERIPEFAVLEPYQLEDVLCLYKDIIGTLYKRKMLLSHF
ncbi:MAG: hypothetical protein ACHQNE_03705 [Candidatus Kapaibacterium sp.]